MKKAKEQPPADIAIVLRREAIAIDEDIQARLSLDQAAVDRYCESHREGAKFPPLRVVKDADGNHWVWDGFHRLEMYQLLKVAKVDCLVRGGTKEDAILLAAGANSDHGLPRSVRDRERSVLMLISRPLWSDRSVKWLAETCRVSQAFAKKVREEHVGQLEKVKTKAGREQAANHHNGSASVELSRESSNDSTGKPAVPYQSPADADELEQLGDATPTQPLPASIVEDAYHRPVPDRLRPVFEQRRVIDALARKLSTLRSELKEAIKHASKAGRRISLPAVDAQLENAHRTLRSGMPAAVCPECDGTVPNDDADACPGCDGVGWIHETRLAQLPRKMRVKVEQHLRQGA